MKSVVGYLATPGGADALALAVRFARTLGADVEACIVLPPDRTLPTTGGCEALLAEQANKRLAEALATVPDDVAAHGHVSFDDSFAEGLIKEAGRLQAEAIVVGGSVVAWQQTCC